ncbi:hypothetical protein FRC03_004895 [Tulasnella sp. 419]|nr:hypothetical protein FRC03_004895 [Tulasnella sp. 419]
MQITVPRSSGTCTRCPMECRLTQSSPSEYWKCQVSLRLEFNNETGKRLSTIREYKFGPVITEPSLLEDMLRRAQLAILNPSVDHEHFVNFNLKHLKASRDGAVVPPLGSTKQLQFSKNVVCLDLSGPDMTDLSFIDLPGIISNVAPGEDRHNIDLIRNLIQEHIKGNCLILLTLTMRDDIENQSAAFLAKQADPQGHRTIGVLTKPDTLQYGEFAPWIEVLENRRHPLRHGYYMTKHPSPSELAERLPYDAVRRREQEYFEDSSNPWWKNDRTRGRLGTPNLTKNLSKLLSSLIDATLPKLRRDAASSRQSARAAASVLPAPVSQTNPTSDLLRLITTFSTEYQNYSNGTSNTYASLIQNCKPEFEKFKVRVARTAPDFRPYTVKEEKSGSITWEDEVSDIEDLEGSEDDEDGLESESEESEEEEEEEEDASHERLNPHEEDLDEHPHRSRRSKRGNVYFGNHLKESHAVSRPNPMDTIFGKKGPMYVDQVKKYISGSLTRELPFNVPFSAKQGLIHRAMASWEYDALECFRFIRAAVASHMSELVEEHFGRFARSGLTDTVESIVQKLIEHHEEETIERIRWLIRLEHRPFTQNQHYLSAYRDKYLSKYRGARRQKVVANQPSTQSQSQYSPNPQLPSPVSQNGYSYVNTAIPYGSDGSRPVSPVGMAGYPGQNGVAPNGFYVQMPNGPQSRSMHDKLMSSKSQKHKQTAPPPQPQQPQQTNHTPDLGPVISQLTAAGFPVSSKSDLERLFASNPYEEEFFVMAEVRAYWQVAYKRIIDILPLVIDEDFLCAIAQRVQETLINELGLSTPDATDKAKEFLSEDPELVAEREMIVARLERAEDVWEKLAKFKP